MSHHIDFYRQQWDITYGIAQQRSFLGNPIFIQLKVKMSHNGHFIDPQKQPVSCSPLSCNPLLLYWFRDVMCWERGAFYHHITKSQIFMDLCIELWLPQVFLIFTPYLRWNKISRNHQNWLHVHPFGQTEKALVLFLPWRMCLCYWLMFWVSFKIVTFPFPCQRCRGIFLGSSAQGSGGPPGSKHHESVGALKTMSPRSCSFSC